VAEMSNHWRVIAEQASREQNPEKLIQLADRVVDLLEKQQSGKQSPAEFKERPSLRKQQEVENPPNQSENL